MPSFRGGLEFTSGHPIRLPPPPETIAVDEVRLGCTERPEVQAGQVVRQGQVLLRPTRAGSWYQISPITGTVRHVRPLTHVDPDANAGAPFGYEVMIESASARVPTTLDVPAPRGRRLETWFTALRQIGAWSDRDGGVGLIAQLAAAQKQSVDTVICEGLDAFPPYPDRSSLLTSFPDDAVLGTIVVGDLVNARNTLMLASRGRAVRGRLGPSCKNYGLRLVGSINRYPEADPTLVAWLFGGRRRLPRGANPVSQGLILIHPWTAIRIGRWFTNQCFDLVRPFFIAWPGPKPVLMPIYALPGQPLASLDPRLATQLEREPGTVVVGNPMMGRPAVVDPPVPPDRPASSSSTAPSLPSAPSPAPPGPNTGGTISKGKASGGPAVPDDDLLITVLPPLAQTRPEPCISCGWCAEACPTSLRPIHLAQLALTHHDDEHLMDRLTWCIECGLCSHVCPSSLPLTQVLSRTAQSLGRRDPVAAPLAIYGVTMTEPPAHATESPGPAATAPPPTAQAPGLGTDVHKAGRP